MYFIQVREHLGKSWEDTEHSSEELPEIAAQYWVLRKDTGIGYNLRVIIRLKGLPDVEVGRHSLLEYR